MESKAGPALLDCYHDYVMGDLALFEVGLSAQEEGYDAVCIDTMSDSGMNAMRSVLDIPVIGPGRASYMMALMDQLAGLMVRHSVGVRTEETLYLKRVDEDFFPE